MDRNDKMDSFLDKLKEDLKENKKIRTVDLYAADGSTMDGGTGRKRAIRSLMNIRMPGNMPEGLLRIQDDYLQGELEDRGVVRLSDVPTVGEQFGSRHRYADQISVWQGDITRLAAGAIVNAANSQMLGCFIPCHRCIDNAIHSAAGMQLREECSRIMAGRRVRYGGQYEEPTGTATLTGGYNLPCDYVIHTVGPIVYGGLDDALRQDLRNCYENVLRCCVENGIRSVAFCCISTGEFHFPNDEAAGIAVETVTDFLQNNEGNCIERIIFNVFKDMDREIYERIFR